MAKAKRLGVLTSGGDCAGLNAVIRAVTFRATRTYKWEVFGIRDGTQGLMSRPLDYLKLGHNTFIGDVLRAGGTFLGTTNKGNPFAYPMPDGTLKDRSGDVSDGYHELGLSALIVIGGDGSMRIVRRLAQQGDMKIVGVPKTIDNDVRYTEYAVGFTTAVNTCVDAMDRLAPTAASHHRIMILETMGRDTGHLALNSGIAGGADVILIPEIPYTLAGIVAKIRSVQEEGRNHALIVVAEGCRTEKGEAVTVAQGGGEVRYGGIGQYLSASLASQMNSEIRVTVLGHVQRGGTPSARDRVIASAFGVHAVDLVAQGKFDRMVAWHDRGVIDVPLASVVEGSRVIDPMGAIAQTARGLGIYIGDDPH
ncbi:MAG: ATP-dependent 6-phosphofructokinase [Alphaproteobacteria bacterium]|nr:ATP-dependent 6-phosphofructokinase [Alphaproteobacteria bacterium]